MAPTGSLPLGDPSGPAPASAPSIGSTRLQKAIERNRRKLSGQYGSSTEEANKFMESYPGPEEVLGLSEGQGRIDAPAVLERRWPKRWWAALKKMLGWGLCFLLFLRLIFSEDGILDFMAMENVLKARILSLENIRKENESLFTDILKIQSDNSFQKQLIKDHLGLIAQDEYLILFAKERRPSKLKI